MQLKINMTYGRMMTEPGLLLGRATLLRGLKALKICWVLWLFCVPSVPQEL
jgi:hypothetical protein